MTKGIEEIDIGCELVGDCENAVKSWNENFDV
jgi:hypothetical protein